MQDILSIVMIQPVELLKVLVLIEPLLALELSAIM